MPARASVIGAPLGKLTAAAAADLALTTSCTVGCGLIDAHAGALGVLGPALARGSAELDRNIALIAGTSTCHMALSVEPRRVSGVWGPYYGAVAPGLWLNEGGQSATGALLDHILVVHAQGAALGDRGHAVVLERIAALRAEQGEAFAARLLVLAGFLRQPLAARRSACGWRDQRADPRRLARRPGPALFRHRGRRRLRHAAHPGRPQRARATRSTQLHVAGGHTRNPLLMELYADTTGCTVVAPPEDTDAVLLGTAMVAAAAAGLHENLGAAASAMAQPGTTRRPDPSRRQAYDRRYRAFLEMHEQRRALDRLLGARA